MTCKNLAKTTYPLYAVNVLEQDHFLIAGGGGSAKTGVPNALVSHTADRSLSIKRMST